MCQHGNRRILRVEPHGNTTVLADSFEGRRLNSPNDLVYRSDGTLYFTDPPFGLPGVFDDPGQGAAVQRRLRRHCRTARSSSSPTSSRARTGSPSRPTSATCTSATGISSARSWCATRLGSDGRPVGRGELLYDMTAAPGEDAIDGIKVDARGQPLRLRPGRRLDRVRRRRAARPAEAAREPAQPRLGRRRRPHALHHGADQRLPDPPATSRGSAPTRRSPDEQEPEPRRRPARLRRCPTRTAGCTGSRTLQGDDAWS